jgi:anaerobic selenocysteine-containing dehydrogenase
LPELERIRSILSQEELFVVVQDCFLTETAMLADLVLPAAMWGEKTGTFTNADRTVHLSPKAVDPPGQARSDFDIFIDFARRMHLTDKDGGPLPPFDIPEEAFDAFAQLSRGRPGDYGGMSYARLEDQGWLRWPCPDAKSRGADRLYTDHLFPTQTEYTEEYGHDLLTGAAFEEEDHRALGAEGKAILKAAAFLPPPDPLDDDYPLQLSTGRRVHHWHTRTKTARAAQLQAAAPEVSIELHEDDARRLEIAEGDRCRVVSRRGSVEGPAALGGPRPGHVFVPFHYGYWDRDDSGPNGAQRAANEMTITDWDPVSKQPLFKVSAVRVEKIA